jgi:very-short-patch-repair endonuclease
MKRRCKGIKKTGEQCSRNIVGTYCVQHDMSMKKQCKAIKKNGQQCTRFTTGIYCGQHDKTKPFVPKKRRSKKSAGEKKIKACLRSHKIKFEEQKSFDHPIHIDSNIMGTYKISNNLKSYFYDFYLPQYNIIIEFDGDQHFGVCSKFHKSKDEYISRRILDHIKTHHLPANVSIIRIDYAFINSLEDILIKCINRVREFGQKCVLYSNDVVYSWLSLSLKDLIVLSGNEYDNHIGKK